ncbi:four-domain proteases inhibitor-like isoform X3 [Dendronephthya gigantea]|uniref:four-domain proteases inhibitor-like isoform X2 n=1 Tax=Dendronephthya gigantea TaxID=151771 RepID=UPI00106C757A|nr:four-domain proteases inhibitor-like isoform X2 [Dendronephthya gigantea]XP_028396604.1 four-domain proteases inhibitor-like isoform X2 [Dendronephthya gigantea]XP_028396605.1 four-domain proteases inhibitor-like isoform X3 [Dendronephthya gigantea]
MKADLCVFVVLSTVYLLSSCVHAGDKMPSHIVVCASDHNTYVSIRLMRKTARDFNQKITIVHKGSCDPKCAQVCTYEYNPQCGTNGQTYPNPCSFKIAQCESDGRIRLAYHGMCRQYPIHFEIRWREICGSDGNTYVSFPLMKKTARDFNRPIRIAGWGTCDPKCQQYCTYELNEQCGTDGKTYANPCMFKIAQCESDGAVRLAYHGECK